MLVNKKLIFCRETAQSCVILNNGVLTKPGPSKPGPTKLGTAEPGHSDVGLGSGNKVKNRVRVKIRVRVSVRVCVVG